MRRASRCLSGSHCVDASPATGPARTRTSLSSPRNASPRQPHVRHLFGIDLEKIKQYDEQRKKRKWEKREEMSAKPPPPHSHPPTHSHTLLLPCCLCLTTLVGCIFSLFCCSSCVLCTCVACPTSRQEIRAMPIRQMQTLLTDKKPADIATPLHLTAAPLAPFFMPASPPCIAITVEKQEVLLPQQLWGKLTFLHLSFNQFAFDLGRKWCEAANHFASLPLTTTPSTTADVTPSSTSPSPSTPAPLSASSLASNAALGSSRPLAVPSVDVSPFDYYQISLIKNPFVRHWFGDYSLSSFRSTCPPHTHRHLLSLLSDHSYATMTAQEPILQLKRHELMGFVFLLDARARIRWRAWGPMTDGDREVLGRVLLELREEDGRERRREADRLKVKDGAEKRTASGVKGGQVYNGGSRANGQQTGSGAVNGGTVGVERTERQNEGVQTERPEKTDNVAETAAVAKG